jgi:hypothetical protein
VAALCLGAVAFAATQLFPLLQGVLTSYRSARDELQTLNSRNEAEVMPTQGVIQQYAELKRNMIEETERSASFYLRQNSSLDKQILESWRMDPYQLAINYRELKSQLAEEAGNPDFLELGKLDDWEEKPRGKPQKEDFSALEKKSCIARVLTESLTADPNTVIQIMQIGEPLEADEAPPVPDVDWMVVRYRIYPVEVSMSTRFSTLGKTLHSLVTIPPATSDQACIGVRSIDLKAESARPASRVKVDIGLNVLDFYEANEES